MEREFYTMRRALLKKKRNGLTTYLSSNDGFEFNIIKKSNIYRLI